MARLPAPSGSTRPGLRAPSLDGALRSRAHTKTGENCRLTRRMALGKIVQWSVRLENQFSLTPRGAEHMRARKKQIPITNFMNKAQSPVGFALRGVSLMALMFAGLCAGPSSTLAQSQYYWDATSPIDARPGSGGTGNWNTTAGNTVWWVSGVSDSIWANGNIANFAGTAGTVTVNTAVTANGLHNS